MGFSYSYKELELAGNWSITVRHCGEEVAPFPGTGPGNEARELDHANQTLKHCLGRGLCNFQLASYPTSF